LKEGLRQKTYRIAAFTGFTLFSLAAISVPAVKIWRRRREDKEESKRVSEETVLPYDLVLESRRNARRLYGGAPTPNSDHRTNL